MHLFWKRLSILLVLTFAFSVRSEAQALKPGEWRTITSLRSVQDVTLASDSVHAWVATSGGAFRMNLRDSTEPLLTLHTTEGLTENDLTAVGADQEGHVFFGGRTGALDIYTESSGHVQQVGGDIRSANYPNKRINSISVFGNRLYVAAVYGLSIFVTANGGYFLATIQRFGSTNQDSVQQAIESGGYIYAATANGVAIASRDAILNDFNAWKVLRTPSAALSLVEYRGTVYVGTTNGLFAVSADRSSINPVTLPEPAGIRRMIRSSDSLYLLGTPQRLLTTADVQSFSARDLLGTDELVTSLAKDRTGLVIGTVSHGVTYTSSTFVQSNVTPNGPLTNVPVDLAYGPSTGLLYMSNGGGLSVYNTATDLWRVYIAGQDGTPATSFNKLLFDSVRQTVWVTSFGSGVYAVRGLGSDQASWALRDKSNGLPSFLSDAGNTFIVTSGSMIDSKGRYVVTDWAANGLGLAVTNDATNFTGLRLTAASNLGLPFGCVTQDMDGNYWVGTEHHDSPASVGVFWVRGDGSANGVIPGGSSQPLASPAVNAILTDQDNEIWCGTEAGVQIIADPYQINSTTNPKFSIRTLKLLEQQVVHTMAVDGVGNKWIGTENGIFVVSPDGADSVARYTTQNSPLIDNFVTSIALDNQRGEAYIGTNTGISRFRTIFRQGNPDYTTIRVYPNPVIQTGEQSPTIFIEGLVQGSTVKVFSMTGKLIASINGTNLGSTVTWDGRDERGHAVTSGLYLITATAPDSGENGEAKVVIVRKP